MHLAFVWQKEGVFLFWFFVFFPLLSFILAGLQTGVVWALLSCAPSSRKAAQELWASSACWNSLQGLVLASILPGCVCQCSSGQNSASWACEAQHPALNPYFPRSFTFQKTPKGWQSSDRNISCTLHALFTRNSLMQGARASPFVTCSESSCLQIAQLLSKWISVLGAFYLKYPLYICVFLKGHHGDFPELTDLQRYRKGMHMATVKCYLFFGQA